MSVRTMNTSREAEILMRRRSGERLQTIADDYGITRERVRQIALRAGAPTGAEVKEIRRKRADASAAAKEAVRVSLRGQIEVSLKQSPGRSHEQLAQEFGVTVREVRSAMRDSWLRGLALSAPSRTGGRVSEADVLDAIRYAAGLSDEEHLSPRRYEELRDERGLSLPGVLKRYGTWNAARKAAGLPVPHISPYRTTWNEDLVMDWVVRYFRQMYQEGAEGTLSRRFGSYEDYELWAINNDGPSGGTVRSLCGPWNEVKVCAFAALNPSLDMG